MININEKQNPLHDYSEFLDHEGKELEIKGQIFPEPIRENETVKCYTKISILDEEDELWGIGVITSPNQSLPTMIEQIKLMKSDISKFK